MKELTPFSVIALYPWGEIKSEVSSRKLQSTSVDGVTMSSKLKKFVGGKLFGFVGLLLDVVMTGVVNSCWNFCNWKSNTTKRESMTRLCSKFILSCELWNCWSITDVGVGRHLCIMIVLIIIQRRGWNVRTQDGIVLFPFNLLFNFRFNCGETSWKTNKVFKNILEMKRILR